MEQVSWPPELPLQVLGPTGKRHFWVPITSWHGAAPSHQLGPPCLHNVCGRGTGLDAGWGHRRERPWGGLDCTGLDCAGLHWAGLAKLGWAGLLRTELGWRRLDQACPSFTSLGRDGLDWAWVGWTGLNWVRLGCTGLF